MTNIEAQTIGTLARLEHLLMVDVARHLCEMNLKHKTVTPVVYKVADLGKLTITAGGCGGGGVGGTSGRTTTGRGAGGAAFAMMYLGNGLWEVAP